jgi:hypothetical protein
LAKLARASIISDRRQRGPIPEGSHETGGAT